MTVNVLKKLLIFTSIKKFSRLKLLNQKYFFSSNPPKTKLLLIFKYIIKVNKFVIKINKTNKILLNQGKYNIIFIIEKYLKKKPNNGGNPNNENSKIKNEPVINRFSLYKYLH